MTENEIVGWHHQLNGHEFEQAPRVGDGQGSLACSIHEVIRSQEIFEQMSDVIEAAL